MTIEGKHSNYINQKIELNTTNNPLPKWKSTQKANSTDFKFPIHPQFNPNWNSPTKQQYYTQIAKKSTQEHQKIAEIKAMN